jgi:hypothetical protein
MNCPRCNSPLDNGARFCGVCGYSFAVQGETISSAPVDATVITPLPPTQPIGRYQGEQPGGFQQSQPGWSQQPDFYQQSQPDRSAANPPSMTYPPGVAPGTMSSTGNFSVKRKRRRSGCWLSILLTLVLLLAVLAGVWLVIARPAIHTMAQAQLDQALNEAEGQIVLFQTVLPQGTQIIHVGESDLNSYLSGQDTDNLQHLHMTILPTGLQLTFTAYGFQCTILAVPIASNGALQVTNVQVQGILWLVMSNAELTTDLNGHFQDIGQQMHRSIKAITLNQHELDITIS